MTVTATLAGWMQSLPIPGGNARSRDDVVAQPVKRSIALVDPVRVSLADLVQLAPAARQLELWRNRREIEDGGSHHTVFKGRGMEFAETRPYQPGDDVRHIDWRVTARSGRAHTKLFREERERPVVVWVDCRPHMFFATRGVFKSVMAARLAALVAWAAQAHGDRVGGRVLSARDDQVIEPGRSHHGVLRLLRALELGCDPMASAHRPATAVSASLANLYHAVRPGSMLFLVSDFHDVGTALGDLLSRIGEHSDVTLCHVSDPLESTLPPAGCYPIASHDGSHAMLDSLDANARREHAQQFQRRQQSLAALSRQHRARYLSVSTTDDPLGLLHYWGRTPGDLPVQR